MSFSINQLTFERNNEFLFKNLHCTLLPGEILQVRGANGCGKSTLLRILAGYIRPEIGTLAWENKNIFHHLDEYTQQICYLGHQNGIKLHLTVLENLKLYANLIAKKIHLQPLKTILSTMELTHAADSPAFHLSAGQKRRLALSRFLISSARLWILDEPTSALDAAGETLLMQLLKQHLQQGGMAIIATHHDLALTCQIKTLYLDKSHERIASHA